MEKHKLRMTRPATSVDWHILPTAVSDHKQNSYVATGKIVEMVGEQSSDGLVKTVTTTFLNESAFYEFISDPVIVAMFADRSEYFDDNGISTEITREII